jgi:NAD-dependent SIR2 family protein deacetylase
MDEGAARACELAAAQILDADYLLIAAGAGFSADSGLPVYGKLKD